MREFQCDVEVYEDKRPILKEGDDHISLRWPPFSGQFAKLRLPRKKDGPDGGERKRWSAEFKAKVALEAIRGELTVSQPVARPGVHQTLINAWKKPAMEGLAGVFSGKAEAAETSQQGEVEKLHAMIGQLVVERDFLRKASGR